MVEREDDDELLGDELVQSEAVTLDPLGHRQEGEVELVEPEHLGELFARLLADGQLDARMALVEDRQHERHVDRAHRVQRADRHPAGLDAAEALELGVGGLELGQDPPGASDEQLAGLGDRHLPSRPLDEREAGLLLEAADLLGERGLGNVLALGGAGEVALVSERNQVPQLPQFHKLGL